MEIDLREVQEGINDFEWDETPEDLHIDAENMDFVGPIHSQIAVTKLGESLSASGDTAFQLRLECVRCLEPFELELSSHYSFILQTGRPDRVEGDEDEALIWLDDDRGKIDLGEEIKDYVLLEVPMGAACSETCAGLCPSCGENLNNRRCDCKTETTDPRWEALRALKDEE
ncbi:MAG: DUF177 domain-containing protein [Candidatus Latescibacteria bacterium]|jgi:uncharacterized protein|nr:DUF177 domain-containing protein [Candidatus Latescibacterota bacterium]